MLKATPVGHMCGMGAELFEMLKMGCNKLWFQASSVDDEAPLALPEIPGRSGIEAMPTLMEQQSYSERRAGLYHGIRFCSIIPILKHGIRPGKAKE